MCAMPFAWISYGVYDSFSYHLLSLNLFISRVFSLDIGMAAKIMHDLTSDLSGYMVNPAQTILTFLHETMSLKTRLCCCCYL